MQRSGFQLEGKLRLFCVCIVLLWPTNLSAQAPAAARFGQAVSFDAIKSEFASPAPISRAANTIEPTIRYGRSSPRIVANLQPLTSSVSNSVIEIRSQHNLLSLGTAVCANGLIVCKNSELTDKFYCVLPDGRKYWANLIGIHKQKDLALLHIANDQLQPITFPRSPSVTTGKLVVSVGHDEQAIGLGMITRPIHDFGLKQPKCRDCIDLGITVSALPILKEFEASNSNAGLEVDRVYPRSVAESSGLLVGDLLQSVNGIELTSRNHLNELARSIKVGQTLGFRVLREGKVISLATKASRFVNRTLHDRWGGGPYSARRFGFSSVIAHDSVILPEYCGGPLVGLDGEVIGINIARSMRVATFSIPIQDVQNFVQLVRPNAKLIVESSEALENALPRW